MSTTTTAKAVEALQARQGSNESLKETLISEIVALFKSHADATPEMVLQGSWASGFVGRTYGAWYVVKSGISAKLLNVPFIAKNFDDIKVQTSAAAMEAELTRVFNEVKATKAALVASDKASGKAFNSSLVEASNAVVLAKNTHTVYSEEAEANFALLEAQVASLRAQLNTAKRITEESLSKIG
jgi:hypothetical protein